MSVLESRGLVPRGLQPRGLAPRGRNVGGIWPPPIEDNLAYALDFRTSELLTLGGGGGNEILSVTPRVGTVTFDSAGGAGDPENPTWSASTYAVFDEADDLLTGSGTVATSGDDYTIYRLMKINENRGGMFAHTASGNDYDMANVVGEVRAQNNTATSQLDDPPYGQVPFTEKEWHVQILGYDETAGRHYGAEDGVVTCLDLVVAGDSVFSFDRIGDFQGAPGTYNGCSIGLWLLYDGVIHTVPQMAEMSAWMLEYAL